MARAARTGSASAEAAAPELDDGDHLRFVDHKDGEATAFCRFDGPLAAIAAAAAVNARSAEAAKATGSEAAAAEVLT